MGSPFQVVQEKLKKVRTGLTTWSRDTFGHIFQKIATLEDVIKVNKAQFEIHPTPAK